jgi:hypothetical protein
MPVKVKKGPCDKGFWYREIGSLEICLPRPTLIYDEGLRRSGPYPFHFFGLQEAKRSRDG